VGRYVTRGLGCKSRRHGRHRRSLGGRVVSGSPRRPCEPTRRGTGVPPVSGHGRDGHATPLVAGKAWVGLRRAKLCESKRRALLCAIPSRFPPSRDARRNEARTSTALRTLPNVAPPGTCPDSVGRAALPVFGNRDWQSCGHHGSAGLKPGATWLPVPNNRISWGLINRGRKRTIVRYGFSGR